MIQASSHLQCLKILRVPAPKYPEYTVDSEQLELLKLFSGLMPEWILDEGVRNGTDAFPVLVPQIATMGGLIEAKTTKKPLS